MESSKARSDFQRFFDLKYKEVYSKNLIEVREILAKNGRGREAKQLNAKIDKFVAKLGIFTIDQVKTEIVNSDIVASFFAKDPLKQNFSELTMREYLEKEAKLELKKPADMRFHNGTLSLERKRVVGGSKSVDYLTESSDITTYYWFKYIGANGGAQDNQYEDIVTTIREVEEYVKQNPKNTIKFCMVVAGGYFTEAKMKSLQSKIITKTSISVVSIMEIGH